MLFYDILLFLFSRPTDNCYQKLLSTRMRLHVEFISDLPSELHSVVDWKQPGPAYVVSIRQNRLMARGSYDPDGD